MTQRTYSTSEVDQMRRAIAESVPPAEVEARLQTYILAGVPPGDLVKALSGEAAFLKLVTSA